MEPGGIEPAPIVALQSLKAEMEQWRAVHCAVQADPALSQLVQSWPTLPEHVRLTVSLLNQSASDRGLS